MTGRRSTILDRVVAGAAFWLPSGRAAWGAAMRAELGAIDERRARVEFALGCVRAVFSTRSVLVELAVRAVLLAVGVVAVQRIAAPSRGVLVEAAVTLTSLSVLAWLGARPGLVGSVAPGHLPRAARTLGQLLLLFVLAWFLSSAAGGGPHDPSGWWLAGASIALYWTAWNALTAAGAEAATIRLILILIGCVVLVWWLSTVATNAVGPTPWWPALLVVASALPPCVLRRSHPDRTQTLRAAFGAALGSAAAIFVAAAVAEAVHPDLTGEAMDPMVGVLLLGAVISALALAGMRLAAGGRLSSGSPARATGGRRW